jgi:excisionase family DNA binding protein
MTMHDDLEESQVALTALITPPEVSRLLGVSLATVKRLTSRGELPHVRVSVRRPRYCPDDVRRFIESRRAEPVLGAPAAQPADTQRIRENERSSARQPSFVTSAGTGGGDASG